MRCDDNRINRLFWHGRVPALAFNSKYKPIRAGKSRASADRFILRIKGKGGHAAMPEQSVDPIVIAAHITTALQTLISRETSPFSPAVVTIGKIEAGSAFN